jgi:hypothetical protein
MFATGVHTGVPLWSNKRTISMAKTPMRFNRHRLLESTTASVWSIQRRAISRCPYCDANSNVVQPLLMRESSATPCRSITRATIQFGQRLHNFKACPFLIPRTATFTLFSPNAITSVLWLKELTLQHRQFPLRWKPATA